jgi:RNA polymerase sigma-70 factor (family 1)
MQSANALTDIELIQLLKKDDQTAFTEIYTRYAESLAGFAGSKLYSLEDARDILHDLFVKLWEERKSLSVTGNLKSYLFAAIRYCIIDRIRRNVSRQEYALQLQAFDKSFYAGGQDLEAKELQEILNKSLDDLAPRTKEIYQLSRNNQYTISEIATMLNLSEQTVKNQLTTALNHLRRSIICIGIIVFLSA